MFSLKLCNKFESILRSYWCFFWDTNDTCSIPVIIEIKSNFEDSASRITNIFIWHLLFLSFWKWDWGTYWISPIWTMCPKRFKKQLVVKEKDLPASPRTNNHCSLEQPLSMTLSVGNEVYCTSIGLLWTYEGLPFHA